MQEKYGFVPEVIDIDLERDGVLFDSEYTGTVTVWLSDGHENFRVPVSDDEAHTGDDHQLGEFTDALLSEVNSILPGGETLCIWFSNRGNDGRFLREKFTGGCYIRSTEENAPFRYDVIDCGDFMLMYRDNAPDLTPPSVTDEDADALIARFRGKYPRTERSGRAFYIYYPIQGELPSMHRIDAVVEEESTEEKLYYRHEDMFAHGDYYVLDRSVYPIHRIAVLDGAGN